MVPSPAQRKKPILTGLTDLSGLRLINGIVLGVTNVTLKTDRQYVITCEDGKKVTGSIECAHEIPVGDNGSLEYESSICTGIREQYFF